MLPTHPTMKAVTFFLVTLLATVAVAAAAAPAAATGGHRGEERIRFRGPLSGDQEVPPVHTAAWGTVRARLRGGTDLAVRFSFAGLGSPVNESIGIHVHRGAKGVNGPILFALTAETRLFARGTAGRGRSRLHLSDEQAAAARAGELYVNVHTNAFPAGELRGQLWPLPARRRYGNHY